MKTAENSKRFLLSLRRAQADAVLGAYFSLYCILVNLHLPIRRPIRKAKNSLPTFPAVKLAAKKAANHWKFSSVLELYKAEECQM